jgi:uncharacterized protein YndB with AHSA1/START domain/DNA-binding transcriptional ArsR family regulator
VTNESHKVQRMDDEAVFRALADASRRTLLDRLFARDGQALGELEAALPGMTRFGVMKHLRVLEAAGLVVTRREGRRKLHFLNPVPIRLIHDRWISKFAEPWVGGMADLKHHLEHEPMSSPKHVYEVYIQTTPERLWQAITDPAFTTRYYYATRVESTWTPGSPISYTHEDGRTAIDGQVVEADPPRRLVHTFHFTDPEQAVERPSRCTWEIQQRGDACLLTLTHDDFDGETKTYRSVEHGWVAILSGLKTLLETGQELQVTFPEAAAANA